MYIDATLGGSGHAGRVLEVSAPNGVLLGIDADPSAIQVARERLARFGDRVSLVEAYFDELGPIARDLGFDPADGVLFDLGVSSPQLDEAERGFSFQHSAPLDMRFGPRAERSADELVNTMPADELERLFREYGEERFARRVAQRIVAVRPIHSTTDLADVVARAKPRTNERIHPATRVFQALRIAVNDELGRLERALPQAVEVLAEGGRLAVITFHSLEDRIVKRFMRHEASGCVCPPGLPVCMCGHKPSVRVLTSHPTIASQEEVAANPRSRSAKLRVAERIGA